MTVDDYRRQLAAVQSDIQTKELIFAMHERCAQRTADDLARSRAQYAKIEADITRAEAAQFTCGARFVSTTAGKAPGVLLVGSAQQHYARTVLAEYANKCQYTVVNCSTGHGSTYETISTLLKWWTPVSPA